MLNHANLYMVSFVFVNSKLMCKCLCVCNFDLCLFLSELFYCYLPALSDQLHMKITCNTCQLMHGIICIIENSKLMCKYLFVCNFDLCLLLSELFYCFLPVLSGQLHMKITYNTYCPMVFCPIFLNS